jgi:putative ABC transport system ATP-binding protein
VFQSFGLLPLLSAAENVELALRIAGAGLRERSERTRELIQLVGLTRRANHRPYELSGGEQQRVAVARALANHPQVVIADEPTGELDSATGAQIFALLRGVADSGVTIVTATHDPFVIQHVDRVEELSDGRLLPPSERVLAPPQQPRPIPQPPRRPTPLR